MNNKLGVYIHIPYCRSLCGYCDYNTAKYDKTLSEYIQVLIGEIKGRSFNINTCYEVDSIHIGGGTPSVLESSMLNEIIKTITDNFLISDDLSIAIETNPEDINHNKVIEYEQVGINRVVIGAQSMIDHDLEKLGRIHTVEDNINAIRVVKNVIPNVGVDLIRDISTISNFKKTIDKCADLDVKHISIYDLKGVDGKYHNWTYEYLAGVGYSQYHITSYSTEQKYNSRHNIKYWTDKDYIGFGVGAHSRLKDTRISNTTKLNEYLSKKSVPNIDYISSIDRTIELVIMGLGYIEGIDIDYIKDKYDIDLCELYSNELDLILKNRYMYIDRNKLKISKKGQSKINDLELMFYR